LQGAIPPQNLVAHGTAITDFLCGQDWIARGLEQQAAERNNVPRRKPGYSGHVLEFGCRRRLHLHLGDSVARKQRWQVVDGKVRSADARDRRPWKLDFIDVAGN